MVVEEEEEAFTRTHQGKIITLHLTTIWDAH